jgi:K(+)-stimulated pyrophosphate-energized sodium pump
MDASIPAIWWIAPVSAVLALITAAILYKKVMAESEGTDKMKEIAKHVREGAMAYLMRQYKVVGLVFIVMVVILGALALCGIQNPFLPIAFLTGGFFSGLCGFIGMKTATNASARTANSCRSGLNHGLKVAFRSGAVMGMVVVGFGLLDISMWYLFLNKVVFTAQHMAEGWQIAGMTIVPAACSAAQKIVHISTVMVTFGMGASTQALFARVGGGIFTKAADVGADLVGKVEAGIPEDDPRNPATIADNVGDNVGDVAGMGADLYESYYGSILATAALGGAVGAQRIMTGGTAEEVANLVCAPMVVAGIGIILSIIGTTLVRCKEGASQKSLLHALLTGTLTSSILIILSLFGLHAYGLISLGVVFSIISGLVAGVIIGQITEYYTSDEYKPTKEIAASTKMGAASVLIEGHATGMFSTGWPVLTIAIGIICAYGFAGGFSDMSMGLYGIGFAAVGMLSTLGITLATDAYGPIADNAGGNAEMAGLPPEVRERTDALDSLGNTTAATGKGFAIGSAALTALALLAAYIENVKLWTIDITNDLSLAGASIVDLCAKYDLYIMNPLLICGLFIGGAVAFVFCALTMKAVGRAAGAMVTEVRRQFREIPGILEGTGKPEYAKCVEISTIGAQKEMLVPSLLAIIIPVATGLVLGVAGVVGLLTGALCSGFALATMLNNAGGAWDNAKKCIEKGNFGGKGSDCHKASVVGDTVGDPYKDTCGPSLNILIKLMTMVSLVFCPLIVKFAPVIQEWLHIATK